MAGTLLSICTDAIEGVQENAVPSTIIGNSSPTAVALRSAALDVGRALERGYKWQALKKEYTFATSEDVTAYDVPEEMRRFINMTIWSATDQWPLVNVSHKRFRELQSGIVVSSIRFQYEFSANQININPAPGADAVNIVFDYHTKYFCESSGGTGQNRWLADSDVSRLDENLMVLGTRYRYLARQGLPYDEEKGDFLSAITDLRADDQPLTIIDVGPVPQGLPVNVADGNWSL
jgi:hypothetical protein